MVLGVRRIELKETLVYIAFGIFLLFVFVWTLETAVYAMCVDHHSRNPSRHLNATPDVLCRSLQMRRVFKEEIKPIVIDRIKGD